MQWVQDSSQSTADNLNTVRRRASRHLRYKKKKYLKAKIEELETNSKIKNIRDLYRGINDFKKGYQSKTNIVKDKKGDFIGDPLSIVARWKNHFSQLLNIPGAKDVRQTEIHTAEPLVPELGAFKLELAIDKLKSHVSPGTDQIPVEMMKARGRIKHYEIHQFIISIWSKEELPEEWKESIFIHITIAFQLCLRVCH